ncbi:MAG: hypothetical protein Q7W45_02155 [Bacteroidota bacterium]|nr:hypothetical protein [Bacteroidota bacterium]MDP3216925.1 hypothetical protein [Deltaproteobacteria bacterium]
MKKEFTLTLLALIITLGCNTADNKKPNVNAANSINSNQPDNSKQNFKTTKVIKKLGEIQVVIVQHKNLEESAIDSYCNAEILIYQNEILIDSLIYKNIEPVGGDYGLKVYDELFYDCLIISKFGDYEGETIIINKKGKIHKSIGGAISIDKEKGLLFSEFVSDLTGFSVFDMKNFKELISMTEIEERPIEFYKDGDRYFFKAINDETENISFWEIEFDLERIMVVDFEVELVKDKKLNQLIDYKATYVQCE